MKKLIFTATMLLWQAVMGLSPAEWRSQSIYFLLTDRFGRSDNSVTANCNTNDRIYCGGTWQGIINQLDYIQGMGFTAIWITPVTKQLSQNTGDGSSYHGYWQQDIYNVNPNHGTSDDLLALSKALHARGMYLMVDVVANHMGYAGAGNNVDYSVFTPFNSASYFHSYCSISNYNDQSNVENCWLGDTIVSLPDLDTTQSSVKTLWNNWISGLVSKYSIDGLRIDTVKHVQKSFWPDFNSAAGVYSVGEIFDGDPAYTCDYQNYMDGVLNYPMYYPLLRAFQTTSGSISDLYNMIGTMSSACADSTLLGNFIENHDNPRFPSYTSDYSQAKNVLSFLFLSDGIPIVYSGQEQHYAGGNDPANREAIWLSKYSTTAELYQHIATTNKIRKAAVAADSSYITSKNVAFYQDSHTIAMKKGSGSSPVITVLSNAGSSGSSYTLYLGGSGYSSGTKLMELYTCTSVTVDSSSKIAVPMASGLPRVFILASSLSNSGLCGSTVPITTATTPTTATQTATITTTAGGCTQATALPVLFKELVTTSLGQDIYISGSISQLGTWDTSKAVALSADSYTSSNPLWQATITLPVGTTFQYKFIKKTNGALTWESDPNRSYTVPTGCTGSTATVTASWK
ncbi:Glycoside hydrolase superfamily [Penicillium robsamsonii]|uniref:Glycoside hydrolase superfamily n=1 Tax=Penicillium robsamsonii TaxID=1792511 RepID=UPI0025475C2B|nr:Glycoside hydrolase superfamily [Penicillium robsamsonii]KAJ5827844.1 Glycoside hydrolase superfamily [Penicillium robsamsonii]